MVSDEIEQSSPLPPDWIEERFRVDRRKLEDMILGKPIYNLYNIRNILYPKNTVGRGHVIES